MADGVRNWKYKKIIGNGGSANVYKAINVYSKRKAAIKVMNIDDLSLKESLNSKRIKRRINREICILQSINHPYIVGILDHFHDKNRVFIVMECVAGIELLNRIGDDGMKEKHIKKYFKQLCVAIYYCHTHNPTIVHRDLKPENIIIDKNDNIKLLDFGLSNYQKGSYLSSKCGTPYYSPPEIINKSKYDGKSFDIWSLGVILYVMSTGFFPYNTDDETKIPYDDIVYPDKFKQSNQCKKLIFRLLQKEPSLRPDIEDVLLDPWFMRKKKKKKLVKKITTTKDIFSVKSFKSMPDQSSIKITFKRSNTETE
jgi:serine/threonine protein kinase